MGGDVGIKVLVLLAGFGAALILVRLYRLYRTRRRAMEPAELQRRLVEGQDLLLLDLRNDDEFNDELGHITGAVNLPIRHLAARLAAEKERLKGLRHTTVVLACRRGLRSSNGLIHFEQAGFRNVYVLKGGMEAWNAAGLPSARDVI